MDALNRPPRIPLEEVRTLASGVDHSEGICVTPDGTMYVGGENGQFYRVNDDGTATEVASTGGFLLGLASDAAGRVWACESAQHAVVRLDPRAGTIETVSTGAPDGQMATPNWGAFGPDGTYYVTDSGSWKGRDGRIFVIRGGRTSLWSTDSIDFPNGCAVSPDGESLWVLESTPGRLVRIPILNDGSAGQREILVDLPGTVPDGITFATDGSVVIACYRPDVVLRWRSDLGVEVLASDPEGTVVAGPTNCVFYGPGLSRIAFPNIGRWHISSMEVPGLTGVPLWFPTAEQLEERRGAGDG